MRRAYEVRIEPRAQKELDKIPVGSFQKIDRAILGLGKDPRPFGVKKLDERIYRIRIQDWRVLYAVLDKEAQVVVLHVKRRNEKTYKSI